MRRDERRTAGSPERLLHGLRMVCAVGLACVFAGLALTIVVLHLGIRTVLTGSMRPTYGPGAVVVTEPLPVSHLRPGMIVLFILPGEHAVFAHRITSVRGPRSAPIVTTKGDANPAPDPWHAQLKSATVPQVVATVPWVGRLIVGIRGPVRILLVLVGGVVAAVAGVLWIMRPRREALSRTVLSPSIHPLVSRSTTDPHVHSNER